MGVRFGGIYEHQHQHRLWGVVFLCVLLSTCCHGDNVAGLESIDVVVGETVSFLVSSPIRNATLRVRALVADSNVAQLTSPVFLLPPSGHTCELHGLNAGTTHIDFEVLGEIDEDGVKSDVFLNLSPVIVSVMKSHAIATVSEVVGYIYFVAWSVSFLPQIVLNFRRKSVLGFSFDFVAFNVVGFGCYFAFNIALFFGASIKQQYVNEYPDGVPPVHVNDVVFASFALAATLFTAAQCMLYDSGGQRVSFGARVLVGIALVFLVVVAGVAIAGHITWLLFFSMVSYVKLAVTLLKYCPQAYLNYRRKSTVGWSIGNILLDFTGGVFSMLQMFLDAFNYDAYMSLFGNPTKFFLGAFTILFDIFFMVQHYLLYPENEASKWISSPSPRGSGVPSVVDEERAALLPGRKK